MPARPVGDRRWEAEGKGHQVKGSLKQAGAEDQGRFHEVTARGPGRPTGPAPSWRTRLAYAQEARVTC